jgi:hypothetical protein
VEEEEEVVVVAMLLVVAMVLVSERLRVAAGPKCSVVLEAV